MIKAIHLVKRFEQNIAVDGVSFDVEEGENLILLGTSGCGKTTTLRMINRLIEPDEGTVMINGVDVRNKKPEELRRGIGYVLQNHGLFPHYNIYENVAIVPRLLKWKDSETKKRANDLFEKLDLDRILFSKYPVELSGGQQQRVGLARALIADPSVLLMDEPFGALDNITRVGIRKEFKNLEELKRKTIIMVIHDVQEAFELADRICLMDKGKIMQIGSPKELLMDPANSFVREFLKEQRLYLELKGMDISGRSYWDLLDKMNQDELKGLLSGYDRNN